MKLLMIVFATLTLAVGGCKKDEKTETQPGTGTGTGTAAAPDKAKDVDPDADYVRVLAGHAEPKPDDPVVVSLTRFQVVKADFDPQTIEGGTATLELDLTSLASGSAKRDRHLSSPDYLDTAQFAKATITVDNVKKTAENTFSADATVAMRGQEKKLPVTFEVLERTADSIRVKGSHTFKRQDFGIGQDTPDQPVANDLTIELQLTLEKTT